MERMPSRRKKEEIDTKPKSKPSPVNVPQSSIPMNVPLKSKQDDWDKQNYSTTPWEQSPRDDRHRRYIPPSELLPQRMPLPIAGAPPIPDSPTLEPVDKGTQDVPLFDDEVGLSAQDQHLRRKSSIMSLGTQDGEDLDEELPPADPAAGTVQTVIEWNHAGHRVFITGTFANWERKFKMHHL